MARGNPDIRGSDAEPPDTDALIARFADDQEGVVGRSQLVGAGVGLRAIEHRLSRNRLFIVVPRVYSVARPRPTRRGWIWAARLWGGEGAALSHETAGELHVVTRPAGNGFHVTVPTRRSKQPPIVAHQSQLNPRDVVTVDGLRVTSLPRTLLDLAATKSQRFVEKAINEAVVQRTFDRTAIEDVMVRANGHRGIGVLSAALADAAAGLTPTDGEAAEALHELLRQSDLPRPLYQRGLLGYQPDFRWPAARLVVEADGSQFHMTPMRRRADRRRDAEMRAAGYRVLRFTYRQIVYEPDYVLRTIAAALGTGATIAA